MSRRGLRVEGGRVDFAGGWGGWLPLHDGGGGRTEWVTADREPRAVSRQADDPENWVGWVRRVTGSRRVAEYETRSLLRDSKDVRQSVGVIVGPRFIKPCWDVTLDNRHRTTAARDDGGAYRHIGRRASGGRCRRRGRHCGRAAGEERRNPGEPEPPTHASSTPAPQRRFLPTSAGPARGTLSNSP